MVALYINFIQLRPLKAYALNLQIGMKGSVVNIPIDIDDMVQVLSRAFDNLATIQIKLKRHVMHKSNYLFETVRPVAVCDALDYLVQTPLYREHNININTNYFKRYADQDIKSTVDFIVDEKDREYSEEASHLLDNVFIKDFLPENVNFDEDSDGENLCGEVDEEVMLIDINKETVENVQVIAPGQRKLPVPWHAVTDIDELCFPKICFGHKFTTPPKFSYADRGQV
ncbi:hypothetical protein AVEN_151122-1 [Araneus ventricosus]|uniref:DUF6570 domain-containing protein n=1 Tax=Araneus ventricosus TaxID=182803 RepID=A0A4Y2K6T9_ARAVE|nr:hypothetical protein AVEN_151122-1 [Araneus ventricosus]